MLKIMVLTVFMLFSTFSFAESVLKVQKIDENVYALVGELSQRSKDNLGNNSTHGVVVTNDGVILIDSGASYLGAKQIHEAIKKLTDQPIKIVINSGGQDHRWLGNDYFIKQGAKIISSSAAKEDHETRADQQLMSLERLIGESLKGTTPAFATEVFDEKKVITFGDTKLELYHYGPAHTAGDAFIWLPENSIMFTGDIVYHNRMLGIGPAQNFQSWINVFEKMAEFKPKHIIPGHGDPSNLETSKKDTYGYLKFLKAEVAKILDNDGEMLDAKNIDQSKYKYLSNFDDLSGRNAQWVFEQMEFDY